jgi:hypothetical protein
MYKLFCDESWTSDNIPVAIPYYVFYGIRVEDNYENIINERINEFKKNRGMYDSKKEKYFEIKWDKAGEEWKDSKKANRRNRYEEFLDIFFNALDSSRICCGYMSVRKSEYREIEQDYIKRYSGNKDYFFFMLYYNFLYFCLIKNKIKGDSYQIIIDNHQLCVDGYLYNIGSIKDYLNAIIYRSVTPTNQLWLSPDIKKPIVNSIQLVSLVDSKHEPLIQLSDLCAGCIRYIIENRIKPSQDTSQPSLFNLDGGENKTDIIESGKYYLAQYFYKSLRSINGYRDFRLDEGSFHRRFSIFHFDFNKSKKPKRF